MHSNLKKLSLVLCCLASGALFAQSQYEVVVKSAFSPVIQDAQKKINFPAVINDTVQSRQKVEYDLLVRPLQPVFKPETIVAPKVGKDQIERLYRHYLKAGVGYLQPLVEYDFSTLRSKTQSFGIHLLSHSSFDQVKYSGPSSFSNNTLGLYSQQFAKNFNFSEQLNYDFDQYHCYGYDADSLKQLYNWEQEAKDIARSYHHVNASVTAYTNYIKTLKLKQMYTGSYDFLFDNYHSYEHNANLGANFDKRIMSSRLDYFSVGGTVKAGYSHNYWDSTQRKEDIWQLNFNPYANFVEENWNMRLGLSFATGWINGTVKYALFPDVTLFWDVVPNILSVYTGAVGEMERLTYYEVVRDNPFLAPSLEQDFDNKYKFYLGTKTNLSHDLSFGALVSVTNYSAMPFFMPDTTSVAVNDSTSVSLKNTFLLMQSHVLSTDMHLDLSYRYRDALKCNLKFDYFSYSTPDTVTVYYKPHYQFAIEVYYSLKQKINLGAQWVFKADAYYPEFTSTGIEKRVIGNWFDWSINAEYVWSKRLRFFMDLNNLIGRSNQMYDFYYTERFNCLLGVKYIFGGE